MNYKEATDQALIEEMGRITGFTERRQEGAKTGTTRVFIGDHELKRAFELLAIQKPEMAMIHMESIIETWLKWLNSFTKADLLTDEPPAHLSALPLLREITQRGVLYRDQTLLENRERFGKSWLFSPTELDDPKVFYPYLMMDIEDALSKRLFNVYQYRSGPDQITAGVPFRLYPTVGISYSMEAWFSFLGNQTDWLANREEAIISMFLKLDPVSTHYASWVISIHYKGSIWLATDQLTFHNPQNRQTSRRAERSKEDHYEHIGLPYNWVDKLPDLRKQFGGIVRSNATERITCSGAEVASLIDTTGLKKGAILERAASRLMAEKGFTYTTVRHTKHNHTETHKAPQCTFFREGMSVAQATYEDENLVLTLIHFPEILPVPVSHMAVGERLYLLMLSERLLEELMFQPPVDQLVLASQYLNQKLLEGATFDPNEVSAETNNSRQEREFEGWKEVHRQRAEELIASVGKTTTALALKKYDLVAQSSLYDTNWLATPKAMEAMMKWTVLNDEARLVQEKITGNQQERQEQDWETLRVMLTHNLGGMVKLALQEPDYMRIEHSYGHEAFTDKPKPISVKWITWTPQSGISRTSPVPEGNTMQYGSGSFGFLIGYNQPVVRYGPTPKAICEVCKSHKLDPKPKIMFHVAHYEQLMKLLGITDRQALPQYFRNYKSHVFLPYYGNSILSNVHPYAQLKDPCSDRFPNGFKVNVYLCKTCLKKLKKEVEDKPLHTESEPPSHLQ